MAEQMALEEALQIILDLAEGNKDVWFGQANVDKEKLAVNKVSKYIKYLHDPILRGSMGFYERYRDVIEYAAKNIPGLHERGIRQNLDEMNKLFGTNYKGDTLVEISLKHWQTLL